MNAPFDIRPETVTFWRCGAGDCQRRHKSAETAAACPKRVAQVWRAGRKAENDDARDWKARMWRFADQLSKRRILTYGEIGALAGISAGTVANHIRAQRARDSFKGIRDEQ